MTNKIYLMNKDIAVMEFYMNRFNIESTSILNMNLLPEILKIDNGIALNNWLRSRSIDLTRSNARLIAKKLRIGMDELDVVLFNRALSLTDTFWIKYEYEDTVFSEVKLHSREHNERIAMTSLSAHIQDLPKIINTELTNIGSFNKAWVKEDNNWWMIKRGTNKQIEAEMLAYRLGSYLGMNMAKYKVHPTEEGMIMSKNFTDETFILEHYNSFKYSCSNTYDESDIEIYYNLKDFNIHEDYTDMILLDAIICNTDRHEFNFGVIKNSNTGEIISLAPNFDNNLALGGPSKPSLYMIKEYLNEFGILEHQYEYLNSLSSELILSMIDDLETRTEMEEYFIEVVKIIKEYTQ